MKKTKKIRARVEFYYKGKRLIKTSWRYENADVYRTLVNFIPYSIPESDIVSITEW